MLSSAFAADILAGVLALALPLTGPLERWAYRSNPTAATKLVIYGFIVVLLWTLAAVAFGIDGWSGLSQSPAAGRAWLWGAPISSLVLGGAVAAFMTITLMPLVQSLRGPRWRRAYAAAVRRGFAGIPDFLPNTATERAAWIVLSLSAGVCEEGLYRGFLIRFLHESGFGLPLVAALVAAALIFGLAHAYQGVRGVLGATVAGLAFGLLFLLTGSLIACMVLHVLIDVQISYVLRPVPGDAALPAEAT